MKKGFLGSIAEVIKGHRVIDYNNMDRNELRSIMLLRGIDEIGKFCREEDINSTVFYNTMLGRNVSRRATRIIEKRIGLPIDVISKAWKNTPKHPVRGGARQAVAV